MTSKLKRLYSLYAECDDDVLLETIHETNQQLQQVRWPYPAGGRNGAPLRTPEELKRDLPRSGILGAYDAERTADFSQKIINRITVRAGSVTIDYNL